MESQDSINMYRTWRVGAAPVANNVRPDHRIRLRVDGLLFAIETVRRADDWNLPPSVGPILLALLAAGTLIGILILLSADRFTLTADRTEIVFRATWRTMRTSWADVTSIRVERGPHRDMLVIVDSQGDELRALFYDPALTPLETVKARLDDLRASA